MVWLADWYKNNCSGKGVGFFQVVVALQETFHLCGAHDVSGS
jgi:deoxyhypusine synthase